MPCLPYSSRIHYTWDTWGSILYLVALYNYVHNPATAKVIVLGGKLRKSSNVTQGVKSWVPKREALNLKP